ncbi:MAG: SEC-C metal-binding domain-containing protein [Clostridia bacterium]|nr:SEC-C metal-binding domain-containing protein [Clostridia bacterium]
MNLYDKWIELAEKKRTQVESDQYWKAYFEEEMKNYEHILENHTEVISGKLSEVADKFNMDTVTFMGFLDGINTSLVKELDLNALAEDSDINLEIDFEKLYYNMIDAKADWLYNLGQWDDVLSKEKRDEIAKKYKQDNIAVSTKIGRNDPCTCGSGKKYKKCCGK